MIHWESRCRKTLLASKTCWTGLLTTRDFLLKEDDVCARGSAAMNAVAV